MIIDSNTSLIEKELLRGWLYLALASLVIPGITAILLVLLRTISIDAAAGWGDLFRAALVIHVDLSVFVWFISIGGILWTIDGGSSRLPQKRAALWMIAIGSTTISISPLFGNAQSILNNYIPVIDNPIFFTGLILIWIGLLFTSLLQLFSPSSKLAGNIAASAALLSILVLSVSWSALSDNKIDHFYFEQLFWGAGHTLQFVYTLLLLISWNIISKHLELMVWLTPPRFNFLMILGALPLIYIPWLYLQFNPLAAEITVGFAQLMRYGNGVAPGVMGILLLSAIYTKIRVKKTETRGRWINDPASPINAALYSSMTLFAAGGVVSIFISGINTIIPAHYHGSIVGITLSFMGLIYLLLPRLGFSVPTGRIATFQPYIYALGQMMHIAGLALSGSEGAQRKTVGVSADSINSITEQAGVFLTRSGGLIAVAGGILFLIVCWRAIRIGRTTITTTTIS